tara:strand:- start:279 stop:1058 length:780 start_codon:yes stop_codon:yes gene_type:complete
MAEKDKNVPPRPKITYHVNYLKSRRAAKAWDKKYKKTHKPDGSPKQSKDEKRARIEAALETSKKSGGIGKEMKRRYSGEGEVDNQARRTLQGSAERAKRMTEVGKSTKSDAGKKLSQVRKAKSDMPDSQKMRTRTKTQMSDAQKRSQTSKASSTMSDAQKRGAVRRSKAAMSDKQKARADSKPSSDTSSSTTSGKSDMTFKEAFRQGLKDRKAGKGMNFTWRGKSYAAVTQDEIDKAQKAGKIKKNTLRAFLNMKRKKK